MKGIILAGGTGSRLWPSTISVSKQLIPIYDKPLIYYPLSTLMLAGLREILVITTPQDRASFEKLFGDGSVFGISISYATQEKPEGLAQAFIIGEKFLNGDSVLMILGDNIFYGVGLGNELDRKFREKGAHIFTYEVSNPSAYGIVEISKEGKPESIEEKPIAARSNFAVTGLYYFDSNVTDVAKSISPSSRGELEITSVIDHYLQRGSLSVTQLSRGTAWLDTGNPDSMHDAASFVRVIEERTGLKIGCPEEIAFRKNWISSELLIERGLQLQSSTYGKYLLKIQEN
jgi:glucose-1-phosphate thymidylyltransferase